MWVPPNHPFHQSILVLLKPTLGSLSLGNLHLETEQS